MLHAECRRPTTVYERARAYALERIPPSWQRKTALNVSTNARQCTDGNADDDTEINGGNRGENVSKSEVGIGTEDCRKNQPGHHAPSFDGTGSRRPVTTPSTEASERISRRPQGPLRLLDEKAVLGETAEFSSAMNVAPTITINLRDCRCLKEEQKRACGSSCVFRHMKPPAGAETGRALDGARSSRKEVTMVLDNTGIAVSEERPSSEVENHEGSDLGTNRNTKSQNGVDDADKIDAVDNEVAKRVPMKRQIDVVKTGLARGGQVELGHTISNDRRADMPRDGNDKEKGTRSRRLRRRRKATACVPGNRRGRNRASALTSEAHDVEELTFLLNMSHGMFYADSNKTDQSSPSLVRSNRSDGRLFAVNNYAATIEDADKRRNPPVVHHENSASNGFARARYDGTCNARTGSRKVVNFVDAESGIHEPQCRTGDLSTAAMVGGVPVAADPICVDKDRAEESSLPETTADDHFGERKRSVTDPENPEQHSHTTKNEFSALVHEKGRPPERESELDNDKTSPVGGDDKSRVSSKRENENTIGVFTSKDVVEVLDVDGNEHEEGTLGRRNDFEAEVEESAARDSEDILHARAHTSRDCTVDLPATLPRKSVQDVHDNETRVVQHIANEGIDTIMRGCGEDAGLRTDLSAPEKQRNQFPVAEVQGVVEENEEVPSVTGATMEKMKPSGEQQLQEQQQQWTYDHETETWHGETVTSSNINNAVDAQLDGGWIYDKQSMSWYHPGETTWSMNSAENQPASSDGTGQYNGPHEQRTEEHPQVTPPVDAKLEIPLVVASKHESSVSPVQEAGALIAERIKALELALHA